MSTLGVVSAFVRKNAEHLVIRLPTAVLEALDAHVARLSAEIGGIEVSRSAAVRQILAKALGVEPKAGAKRKAKR